MLNSAFDCFSLMTYPVCCFQELLNVYDRDVHIHDKTSRKMMGSQELQHEYKEKSRTMTTIIDLFFFGGGVGGRGGS